MRIFLKYFHQITMCLIFIFIAENSYGALNGPTWETEIRPVADTRRTKSLGEGNVNNDAFQTLTVQMPQKRPLTDHTLQLEAMILHCLAPDVPPKTRCAVSSKKTEDMNTQELFILSIHIRHSQYKKQKKKKKM